MATNEGHPNLPGGHASVMFLLINQLQISGADRDRTGDPLLAKQVLSQLSYRPECITGLQVKSSGRPAQGGDELTLRKNGSESRPQLNPPSTTDDIGASSGCW